MIKEKDNKKYWICPICKLKIEDIKMKYCKYDYGCPKCGISFHEFTYMGIPKKLLIN